MEEDFLAEVKKEFRELYIGKGKEIYEAASGDFNTGTTIIGLTYDDNAVIAADTKATGGHSVATKQYSKLRQIGDNVVIGGAGGVGDTQRVMRALNVYNTFYRLENGEDMPANVAASKMSQIIAESGGAYAHFILVGKSKEEGEEFISVYSIDGAGGKMGGNEREYMATGSGMQLAEGIARKLYAEADGGRAPGMDDLITAAVEGIDAAKDRDTGSGGDTHAYAITLDGVKRLNDEDIKMYRGKKKGGE